MGFFLTNLSFIFVDARALYYLHFIYFFLFISIYRFINYLFNYYYYTMEISMNITDL